MIFLSVVKNDNGDWVILKVITNPVNVRGNKTGNTYGNISFLTLDERRDEGFWTQRDVYDNIGEFMVFKEKTTAFDEDAVEVVNTYSYERMDLDLVKADLLDRVVFKRDDLYATSFTFNGNEFSADINSRLNIQLIADTFAINESYFPNDFKLETVDGTLVEFDIASFKLLVKALFDFTIGLYTTERSIKDNIRNATVYEDIRAAAQWDGNLL